MDVVKLPAEKANYIEEGSMLHTHVHPETDSHISAVTRPTGRRSASITSLYVPEEHRGKGIGKLLLNSMMNEFPSIQGQVSSKAAAKNAYKSGRRLAGNESASLEDVYKKIDEDSSANMWTHKADGGDVDGITAYHGSPHDFEQFDTSKIGTGEGAQAYGHGLYFASHEPVAKGYRDALAQTRNPTTSINELIEQMSKNSPQSRTHKNIQWYMKQDPMLVKHVGDEDIVQHIHDALNGQNTDGTVSESALDAYGKLTDKLGRDHKGHMYEVHINAHPHHMLDWDKPLSEQSEHVRNVMIPRLAKFKELGANFGNDPSGAELHRAAHPTVQLDDVDWERGPKAQASDWLLKHGIKGIKYLDAGSRGDKAEPTHNYVVFDHNDVRIKRKYERGGRVRFSQGGTDSYDYRGEHQAPGPEDGAPLHDLTKVYPDDVYGPNGFQYYGETGDPSDRTNFSLVQNMRGKPNAPVTVYRAVPNVPSVAKELAKLEEDMANYRRRGRLPSDAWTTDKSRWYDSSAYQRDLLREKAEKEKLNPPKEIGINAGDWVTTNRQYAKDHGESALNGNYKILTKKAKAKELFTAGDSHHEWGYHPEKKAEGGAVNGYEGGGDVDNDVIPHGDPKREQNLTAFQKGNHPEVPHVGYHGTGENFSSFNPRKYGFSSDAGVLGTGFYLSNEPKIASSYPLSGHGNPNVMPLHLSMKNPFVVHGTNIDHGFSRGVNKTKDMLDQYFKKHPEDTRDDWDLHDAEHRLSERNDEGAAESLHDMISGQGYDGIIYKYKNGGKEIVVFDPRQIKSATGNRGTFDPKNPDITKSTGGDVGHRVHFPSLRAVYD